MAIPLIIGAVLAGVGIYLLASFTGILIHWTSIGAGLVSFGYIFYYLVNERPVDLGLDEIGDTLVFSGVSLASGFVVFKLVQALFAVFGGLIALIGALLGLGVFLFGGSVVAGFITQSILFVAEVIDIFLGDN
jgi:hypothetical protein